jgi:hypothetical protein
MAIPRKIRSKEEIDAAALKIACPECSAAAEQPCNNLLSGKEQNYLHKKRRLNVMTIFEKMNYV